MLDVLWLDLWLQHLHEGRADTNEAPTRASQCLQTAARAAARGLRTTSLRDRISMTSTADSSGRGLLALSVGWEGACFSGL